MPLLETPGEVLGLIDPVHVRPGVDDVDLRNRAWVLSETPIGRKRLIKQLEQKRAIHAVVAHHDNDLLRMQVKDEPQGVGSPRNEVLQRIAVGKSKQVRSRTPNSKQLRRFGLYLIVRSPLPGAVVEINKAIERLVADTGCL